jgi:transposase InsO family protein
MDNGSEFTSNRFKHLLANNGILENLIPPGDHAQNGRVERQHLTILNTVRVKPRSTIECLGSHMSIVVLTCQAKVNY